MACNFCDTKEQLKYLESHQDSGIEYKLYQCPSCGVQFWDPLKNPGAEWYERDYRYAGINKDPEVRANWSHKQIITFLSPFKGKVLDIGCGTGNFLYYAKKKGWSTYGFDFDRQAINAARNIFHLEHVEVNDLSGYAAKHSEEQFDLVTFFDVFEHIDNHSEFIEQVFGILKSGGYIALCMPYRKGARWLKPNDLPPRHLTRWDRSSLSKYLAKQGFETIFIKRRTEGISHVLIRLRFKYGSFFSFNLVNRIKQRERKNGEIKIGSKAENRIYLVGKIARLKDWFIFGIPALCIYIVMLLTSQRYISLFAIARKK